MTIASWEVGAACRGRRILAATGRSRSFRCRENTSNSCRNTARPIAPAFGAWRLRCLAPSRPRARTRPSAYRSGASRRVARTRDPETGRRPHRLIASASPSSRRAAERDAGGGAAVGFDARALAFGAQRSAARCSRDFSRRARSAAVTALAIQTILAIRISFARCVCGNRACRPARTELATKSFGAFVVGIARVVRGLRSSAGPLLQGRRRAIEPRGAA